MRFGFNSLQGQRGLVVTTGNAVLFGEDELSGRVLYQETEDGRVQVLTSEENAADPGWEDEI